MSTPEVGGDQPETMSRRDDSTLEWLAVQSVCTVSIFAALLGYDIGVMSGALLPLSRDLSFTSSQEEVAVGCLNFVSAAGSIGGGFMYNKLGAVRCVRIAVILYALGMFIIACSYGFAQIFVGRVVCGLGVGEAHENDRAVIIATDACRLEARVSKTRQQAFGHAFRICQSHGCGSTRV